MTKPKEVANYVCINCGQKVKELSKKYSNTMKTVNCVSEWKIIETGENI